MKESLLREAANIAQLKATAKSRIPGFVYEYLCGGCNEDLAVANNRRALEQVFLDPHLLTPANKSDLSIELLGKRYRAPFGVAPLGLSGLVWPKAVWNPESTLLAFLPGVLR